MKKKLRLIASFVTTLTLLFFITACSSSNTNSSASNNEKSGEGFPKKEITLIVPYSPGGGYDTAARMLAPYWEKYLPNDVKIVVENKDGGNGNVALGELTKAKPDGYTVALVNLPGHFVNQVLDKASYDLTKFSYVGNITKTIYVAGASKKSGFKSLEDLQDSKEVVSGITNISSTDGLGVLIAADKLGVKVKTINHKGSTEAILSATRGDIDWVQYPVESLQGSFESGELQPLWVYNDERLPDLPDVPTIKELGHEELLDSIAMYRAIAAPEGTSEEVLTILRESFMKAVNDEEYKQKVEESGALWNPGDYQQVEKAVNDAVDMLTPYKDLLEANS